MHSRLLIDGIVRQTTVLIAQLSTAAGVRAPLSHVADQVFLELSREIEAQGVKRQVVADMFGMALRSYQKKVQRLMESYTVRDKTLWQAVFELIERENPTRERVEERFTRDGEREIAAVLRDLVKSGLVYVTGSGSGAVYGATSEHVQKTIRERADRESLAHVLWLAVFRGALTRREEVAEHFNVSQQSAEAAVADLLSTGRISEMDGVLSTRTLTVPFGAERGFEAAVLDHFQTVARAIARRVQKRAAPAQPEDRAGGSTFTFALSADHPLRGEVEALFGDARQRAQAVWDRVSEHNQVHPLDPERRFRLSYYLGQTQEDEDE